MTLVFIQFHPLCKIIIIIIIIIIPLLGITKHQNIICSVCKGEASS
jgi:hypothetical protein